MTFGEKLRQARLARNLSQKELSEMTGISERSLYSYEQTGIFPRSSNVRKLADVLDLSVGYLLECEETNVSPNIEHDIFLANVKNAYGSRGAKEAAAVLSRATALFAGGELDDEAKDAFFRSIMEVYLESKEEARAKFTSQQRMRKTKK